VFEFIDESVRIARIHGDSPQRRAWASLAFNRSILRLHCHEQPPVEYRPCPRCPVRLSGERVGGKSSHFFDDIAHWIDDTSRLNITNRRDIRGACVEFGRCARYGARFSRTASSRSSVVLSVLWLIAFSPPQVVTHKQSIPGFKRILTLGRRGGRVDACPGFCGSAPAQVLVRTNMVVEEAKFGEGPVQGVKGVDANLIELRLQCAEEALDAAVLPGAARIDSLVANAERKQRKPKPL